MADELEMSVDEAKMDLWLVGHGGVALNSFALYLERFQFKVRTPSWQHTLSHSPRPLPLDPSFQLKAALYVFGHPFIAICSMKARGVADEIYHQLNRPNNQTYSDGNLMDAIYNQFLSWTFAASSENEYPIYRLNYDDLFDSKCLDVLFKHRKKKRFPFRRIPRTTANLTLCERQLDLGYQHYDMLYQMLSSKSDCNTTIRSRLLQNEAEIQPLPLMNKFKRHENVRDKAYVFVSFFVIFVLIVNVIALCARKYSPLKGNLRYSDYRFEKYKKKYRLNKTG